MMYNIPKDKQTLLFTHIRLAHGFSNHKKRLQAVQARLHAISILGEQKGFSQESDMILVLVLCSNLFSLSLPLPTSVFKCTPRVSQQYSV